MAPAWIAGWGISAFLLGIAISGSGHLASPRAWLLVAALTCIIFHKSRNIRLFLAICLGFAGGILYYHAFYSMQAPALPPGQASFYARITSDPRMSGDHVRFDIEPLDAAIRIRAIYTGSLDLEYGDALNISGKIFSREVLHEPDVMMIRRLERMGSGGGNPIIRGLYSLRKSLLSPVHRLLPEEKAAFLEGVLLGEKDGFPDSLRTSMLASGTTHLTALSGYNVSLVVFAVHLLLFGMISSRFNFYFTTVIIIGFALMTAAEPSIVRASIMGLGMLWAKESGREANLGFMLIWTALMMALWDPGVIFSAGFLLSFASLLGVGYVVPAILNILRMEVENGGLRDLIISSFSAQVATMPVAALLFGGSSWIGLFANLVILPFMPAIMLIGFLFLGLTAIYPPTGMALALLLEMIEGLVLGLIHWFASFGKIGTFTLPAYVWMTYIILLISITFIYGREKPAK